MIIKNGSIILDNKLVKKLLDLIKSDKVYYQDNKVGSIFNSYLSNY